MRNAKETTYDTLIAPLMTEIIGICQEHKINMVASFSLGRIEADEGEEDLLCTTALHPDKADEAGVVKVEACRRILMGETHVGGGLILRFGVGGGE